MKKIIFTLVIIFLLVLSVGIYKFNILNDDIYVETASGELVRINETEEE